MASLCLFWGSKVTAQQVQAPVAPAVLPGIMSMPDDTSMVRAFLTFSDTSSALSSQERLYVTSAMRVVAVAKRIGDQKGLISLYDQLFHYYYFTKNDFNTAFDYINYSLQIARKLGAKIETVHALAHVADCYIFIADYAAALESYQEALRILKGVKGSYRLHGEVFMALSIGRLYAVDMKHFGQALPYDLEAISLAASIKDTTLLIRGYDQAARDHYALKDYHAAYRYCRMALSFKGAEEAGFFSSVNNTLGAVYRDAPDSVLATLGVASADRMRKTSMAFKLALSSARRSGYLPDIVESLGNMSGLMAKTKDFGKAYYMHVEYLALKDSLENGSAKRTILQKQLHSEFNRQADSLKFRQQLASAELRAKKAQSYYFIGALFILLASLLLVWRSYIKQRKSNTLLSRANGLVSEANAELSRKQAEITGQRDRLTKTLEDLNAAQQQLIQAEKMASLGELTAGIAHEIQNPLNFVNNFSDVSVEMIGESLTEFERGEFEEAKAIIKDLQKNIEKINFHGKRADGIVKSMLEHSRPSAGSRELTDVNKLISEMIELAYQGFRAKDKMFSAELGVDLDEGLPLVPLISQDIGRVIVNLLYNAFYAVRKKKVASSDGYDARVSVNTSYHDGMAFISVIDNGDGVPEVIRDKIMQPFFTTKPTGEGTGLGLSLSYDIVVRAHAGKLFLDHRHLGGTEMVMALPVTR
ncbi:ATP-binding protein [Mucilaginibacter pedocola]|uniref:ATP-binding protein n=1 Tax=Mucilaginibacter pedocola TaxID=1792845 RepID=UPI001EE47A18|nr:ATP-binding protein [Mucilaginibacter pedocola]